MPATGSSGDTANKPVPSAPPSTQQPTISRSSTCTSTTTSTRSVDNAVPTLRLPGQVVSASTWGRAWVPLPPPPPGIERTRTLLSIESEVARGRMAGGDSGATARADGSGMDWLGWAGVGGRKRGLWWGNDEGRRNDLESDVVSSDAEEVGGEPEGVFARIRRMVFGGRVKRQSGYVKWAKQKEGPCCIFGGEADVEGQYQELHCWACLESIHNRRQARRLKM